MSLLPRVRLEWRWGNLFLGVQVHRVRGRYWGENSFVVFSICLVPFLTVRVQWAWTEQSLL